MDYAPLIEKRRARLEELERQIADPSLFDNRSRAEELMREHRRAQELLRNWDELCDLRRQEADNTVLAAGDDPDLAEMARC